MRQSSLLLLLCLTFGLAGCSRDTPEYMLQDYSKRVANVLEVELPQPDKAVLPLFPKRRFRILKTEEVRQGLLEVLDLKICNLVPLIAERNSSLGKVYRPSKKLAYELKFLAAIRDCYLKTRNDDSVDYELRERIQEIYAIKKRNISREAWNGIYLSEAIEANFSRGERPLHSHGKENFNTSYNALLRLFELLNANEAEHWQTPEDLDQLEPYYQTLSLNRSGAKLLQSLELLTRYLNYTANQITTRLQQRAMCPMGKPTPQAKILQNVFAKYYAAQVQPYMALVDKSASRWLQLNDTILQRFTALHGQIPESMETYRQSALSLTADQGIWMKYIRARDKHTSAWQKILKQCGLMPGQARIQGTR